MKKVILAILDGYGISSSTENNAIFSADSKNLDKIFEKYNSSTLICSGKEVGLPSGTMGNSEVGHLNIGAGRVVYQDISRIDKSIEDGSFEKNETLLEMIDYLKEKGKNLHIMGLCSNGGVHSSIDHIKEIVRVVNKNGFNNVYLHPFTDGRDTPPNSGIDFIEDLENFLSGGKGKIASISGRFYSMDRDNRWERVEKSYRTLVNGEGKRFLSSKELMESSYKNGLSDEFIEPALIEDNGKIITIDEEDGVIFINYRSDRAREISIALNDREFNEFETKDLNLNFVTMTKYREDFTFKNLFPKLKHKNILGEIVSTNDLSQLRISETEKFAHVTFFFNGGEDRVFKGEDRILIDSPKVETYDLKPEMSSEELTSRLLLEMDKCKYDLIVLNYPNCDMVGHTGVFSAAVSAVESVDRCIGRVYEKAKALGYTLIITADHGNAEKMFENGVPFTAHTKNVVPFVIAKEGIDLSNGRLCDIAPTILDILGIEKPKEMDGNSLIIR